MRIEEPYEYRERLTMPKFIVNASGDQFFLPDSSRFYFDDLRGEKHLRYVPNADHSLARSDALESVHAFYAAIVSGTPRPAIRWTFERDGSIKVVSKERPSDVKVWQAMNPKARNFRLDAIGAAYTSTALTPSGPNTWVARIRPPPAGMDRFLHRADVPERREVRLQGNHRRARAARHAGVCGADSTGRTRAAKRLEQRPTWRTGD